MTHKTIYIVDDDSAVRESLRFLLETHGYTVTCFHSGEDFLRTDLQRYDTPILLDVRMPGRDGLEVLKVAIEANPKLVVIMMSGHALSPETQAAKTKIEKLTKRETEISALLVDGKANKEIALILDISVRTVETHRAHLMSKLDIKSLSALVKLWLLAQ